MSPVTNNNELPADDESPHFSFGEEEAGLAAWTEIEAGRFMPRRVRGSYLGRTLG